MATRPFTRWGEARIIERLVRAYRLERPDIVIPTFLDVPGQHGHHRAMTRAAEAAIMLAADPDYASGDLKPWKVSKYYLPAWSGGGDTYDDEVPPPDTTVTVTAEGRDPATGADYDRIGEWSRYYHASQGMGHWPAPAGQGVGTAPEALRCRFGDRGNGAGRVAGNAHHAFAFPRPFHQGGRGN